MLFHGFRAATHWLFNVSVFDMFIVINALYILFIIGDQEINSGRGQSL